MDKLDKAIILLIIIVSAYALGAIQSYNWTIKNARFDGWIDEDEYTISYGNDAHGWRADIYKGDFNATCGNN